MLDLLCLKQYFNENHKLILFLLNLFHEINLLKYSKKLSIQNFHFFYHEISEFLTLFIDNSILV